MAGSPFYLDGVLLSSSLLPQPHIFSSTNYTSPVHLPLTNCTSPVHLPLTAQHASLRSAHVLHATVCLVALAAGRQTRAEPTFGCAFFSYREFNFIALYSRAEGCPVATHVHRWSHCLTPSTASDISVRRRLLRLPDGGWRFAKRQLAYLQSSAIVCTRMQSCCRSKSRSRWRIVSSCPRQSQL